MPTALRESVHLLPGLALSCSLAGLAFWASALSRHFTGTSVAGPILLAILAGLFVRNVVFLPDRYGPGIRFSFRRLLRIGVIGLGFDFSAKDILSVGGRGLALDLMIIALVYGAALFLAKREGLSTGLALLLGTGTAICGASAIVAANAVIRGKDEEVAFSVASVTLFGTLSMFLFPLGDRLFHLSNAVYGAWAGSSIHEVGQVIGATLPYSRESLQLGTVLKLTRVALLLPVILFLEAAMQWNGRGKERSSSGHAHHFPWFVLGFAAIVVFNFSFPVPPRFLSLLQVTDSAVLAVSMAAMGLETDLSKMLRFGWKPFQLGVSLWIFVSMAGLLLSTLLYAHVR